MTSLLNLMLLEITPKHVQDIGYLLDDHVKVALVYGDRGWSCNWISGENVSMSINYRLYLSARE